jgi:peptide/nickel transport system substrate-binding protein
VRSKRVLLAGMIGMVLVAGACAPAVAPSSSGGASTTASSQGPKVLTLAVQRELKGFAKFTGVAAGGGNPGAGNNQISKIGHSYLALEDETATFVPQIAFDLPSVEKGTWKINPDGTMDTTWKLRPNIKWHDGTPFTAEDLVFGSLLFRDTDFPVPPEERLHQVASTSAPDPNTFVVHWKSTVVTANIPTDFDPLPRHLLEDLYRTEKQQILITPLLGSDWVGLGPYKIARWVEGVEVEFVRFDDYFMGPAPLDRIIVKYISDANTMVANIMAGNADVVLSPGVNLDVASDLRQRWQGTGNQVLTPVSDNQQFLRPQFRPEIAQPRNGAPIQAVRKAMYTGMDRELIAAGATAGLGPIADNAWVSPTDPWRRQLESAIVQYPYDPNRALQLFAEAGWTRGPDGILVHQASGERFESKIAARPTSGADKILALIADQWKTLGVQMDIQLLSPAQAADRRVLGTQAYGIISSQSNSRSVLPPMHTNLLATDANRWSGRNLQGYSNPRVDVLIDRVTVALDERDQMELHRQLLRETTDDVALMALYWQVDPVLVAAGVTGVTYNGTSNIYQWSKN